MYTLKKYMEEARVELIPDWFSEIEMLDPDPIEDRPFKIRWHQVTGLNLAMVWDRAALFDEQGTGKSIQAQAWVIWNAAVGNKCVCLMPPILLGQFVSNLKKTFKGVDNRLKVVVYKGLKAKRCKMVDDFRVNGFPDIVLMSYQLFMKEGWMFKDHYEALLADEAKLGNEETATNKEILNFMGEPGQKNALILTGTPAGNDLRDLYGFIQFLTPDTYRSRLHFNTLHVDMQNIPTRIMKGSEIAIREVAVVKNFRNLELLNQNLYKRARRVEKKDVLELKEKNIIPFSLDLSEPHMKAYRKFVTEMLLEFDDGSILNGVSSAAMRNNCMQAVVHPDLLGVKERSEIFEAIDYLLESILPTGKVLIFAHYRKTVEAIVEQYKQYNPAVIYGGSNTEKNRVKFLEDPTCRMAVANYRAGGIGLNFQSVCSNIIAAEPTTVPGDFDQATDRIHRSGQVNICNIYVLLPKGTAFVKSVRDMMKKRMVIGEVVSVDKFRQEMLGEVVTYGGREVDLEVQAHEHVLEGVQPSTEDGLDLAPGWQTV